MSISFNNIPSNWRLPLHWVEVDGSLAGAGSSDLYALLVGIKLAAGSAAADVPVAVSSQAQADTLFGAGSMLARMVKTFFSNNRSQTLFCLPVVEPTGGVAATGTLTFTGPATAAGIIPLYIAGQLVQVPVALADTAAQIATKAAAAINALGTLPVTAAAAAAVLTLTSRWKGLSGNDTNLTHSYRGLAGGESLPAGAGVTIAAMSGGMGAPDFTNAIANLGDQPYEFVALPFGDATSRGVWETEYGFSDSGRWGWLH